MATRIQRIRMVAAVVAVSTLALAGMASAKVVVGNVGENYLMARLKKTRSPGWQKTTLSSEGATPTTSPAAGAS